MKMTTLYSTREPIPEYYLEFLTSTPENHYKKNCEVDIDRIRGGLFVGKTDMKTYFCSSNEYQKSSNKFDFARSTIAEHAKGLGIEDQDARYFSFLMTHLCFQKFAAVRSLTLMHLGVGDEMKQIFADNDQSLPVDSYNSYKLLLHQDKLIYISEDSFFYNTENGPKYTKRNIHYTFYPDKTMQMSMDNPKDAMKKQGQEYFEKLSTNSKDNLQKVLGEDYKANDPYNGLTMDCDPKSCELFTKIVNQAKCPDAPQILNRLIDLKVVDLTQKLNPQEVSNQIQILNRLIDLKGVDLTQKINPQEVSNQINTIAAIERLSNSNPYTIARLIDKYITNTQNDKQDLDLSNALYNQLSQQCKTKIDHIAAKLQERCESKGCLWKISDCLNIVVNFFLSLVQYFGFNTSSVITADFDKFCEVLAKKPPIEKNTSQFSQTYINLKNSRNIDLELT